MRDDEWNAIRPGAKKAKELGCTCPGDQPHHKSQGAYYQDATCPVHTAHTFPCMGFREPCPPTSVKCEHDWHTFPAPYQEGGDNVYCVKCDATMADDGTVTPASVERDT